MQEEEFFRSEGIVITRTLAHFGSTSYPISNVSLLRVGFVKRASPIAITLGIIGGLALLIGSNLHPLLQADQRTVSFLAGAAFILAAVVVQAYWPKKEFTFVLKANSGDVETFTTEDHTLAGKVKAAIEQAIGLRI